MHIQHDMYFTAHRLVPDEWNASTLCETCWLNQTCWSLVTSKKTDLLKVDLTWFKTEDFYTALILRSLIIALSNFVEKYKATNKEYIQRLTFSTLDWSFTSIKKYKAKILAPQQAWHKQLDVDKLR